MKIFKADTDSTNRSSKHPRAQFYLRIPIVKCKSNEALTGCCQSKRQTRKLSWLERGTGRRILEHNPLCWRPPVHTECHHTDKEKRSLDRISEMIAVMKRESVNGFIQLTSPPKSVSAGGPPLKYLWSYKVGW